MNAMTIEGVEIVRYQIYLEVLVISGPQIRWTAVYSVTARHSERYFTYMVTFHQFV